ncbi:MAG: DMT family transporter [Acidimicrobiia bacterium]
MEVRVNSEAGLQRRIWSVVALTSLGWGTAGVMIRVAFEEGLEPFQVVAFTSAIAAVGVLVFMAVVRRGAKIDAVTWRVGAVMSVISVTIPFVTRNLALQYASAGFIGLAAALIPLATAIAAHLFLPDEPLQAATIVGFAVGLAGVAVLVLSGDAGIAEGGRPGIAGGLSLIGVVSVALGAVYAKKHAGRYSPIGLSAVQFMLGSVITAVLMFIVEGAPSNTTGVGWASLAYIGLLSTFMPVALYYWLIRHVTVTYSAVIGYIIPLVAVVVGILVLDEELQPGIIVGGSLILAGVVITDRIRLRNIRASEVPQVPL